MRRVLPLLLSLLASPMVAQDWSGIESAVERAIRGRVFPGAVVVVGRSDTILMARGYGRLYWEARAPRPSPDSTLWDLASLTKVMATASSALRLADRNALDLDAPVSLYLPEFSGPTRDSISVRMLLNHTSGLRAYAPLWRDFRTRDGAVHALLGELPRFPPGSRTIYSDLNAMLLGLVIEAAGGTSLDSVAAREVFEPLGLRDTWFGVPLTEIGRTAPSRIEGRRPVAGTVHDDNARRLGVAGHAGVFSTGMDVARFAQTWLALARGQSMAWVRTETAGHFLQRTPGLRPLGWAPVDTTLDVSAFGRLANGLVVGHNGWTGTSLWIDSVQDLFVVFLANRSISPRGNITLNEIRFVRADVSDAARRGAGAVCLAMSGERC